MADKGSLLSVIVTTYTQDRLPDVLELLDGLQTQTCPRIEVLFVGERDRELCRAVGEHARRIGMQNLRTLFNEGVPGLSTARNVAIPKSQGDIVAFLDDDVVPPADWAEQMLRAYIDTSIIGVTGAARPLWMGKEPHWFPKHLYWLLSCTDWTGYHAVTDARSLWGANMSIRRSVFESIGLFLPVAGYHMPIAEDLEFSLRAKLRLGGRLLYSPLAWVWHKVYRYRLTLRHVAARSHHMGVSRRILKSAYGPLGVRMSPEKKILRDMLADLFQLPNVAAKDPYAAWNRLAVTCTVLASGALGYAFPGSARKVTRELSEALRA